MRIFKKPLKYTIVKAKKKIIPDGLWTKCPKCNQFIYTKILNENEVIDNAEFKTTTKAMRYAREMMEEIYRGE